MRAFMNSDARTREQLLKHCGDLHEDDGVDPRYYFQPDKNVGKRNHKTHQLCDQVAKTLGLVLSGEFRDERLHNLQVISVVPAPNTSQLSVTLQTDNPCDNAEIEEILQRLNAVSGQLRCAVAAAITRKRTPKLLFRLVSPRSA